MGNTPSHRKSAGQIDSPTLWAAVRGAEILYGVIFLKMAGVSHCRRYFRKTPAWFDVQEAQWKRARLRVLVRRKKKPKAVLEFLPNPLNALDPYWPSA